MKTKQEYLDMIPPHLDKGHWDMLVEKIFSGPEVKQENLDFLDEYFNTKPKRLVDRWVEEAEEWDKMDD